MPKTRKARKARRGGEVEQYLLDAKANLRPTQTKCASRDAFGKCVQGGRKRKTRRARRHH